MSEKNTAGTACGKPACDLSGIHEAVCIHTKKITDSCRDKDCIEDLRVYLTRESQTVFDRSTAVKARCAELLHVYIDVEPVTYSPGYYSIDCTYYYRIVADAIICGIRPSTVYGLAIFTKRCILCGGTGSAKTFTSCTKLCEFDPDSIMRMNLPEAVVEVVDPMILAARIEDTCERCCVCPQFSEIPQAVCKCFDDELVLGGESKRLLVTLGQFSIIRLERDTQLLIPAFDYCIPTKQCSESAVSSTASPCEMFSQVEFPVDEFFPAPCSCRTDASYNPCNYRTCGT